MPPILATLVFRFHARYSAVCSHDTLSGLDLPKKIVFFFSVSSCSLPVRHMPLFDFLNATQCTLACEKKAHPTVAGQQNEHGQEVDR